MKNKIERILFWKDGTQVDQLSLTFKFEDECYMTKHVQRCNND